MPTEPRLNDRDSCFFSATAKITFFGFTSQIPTNQAKVNLPLLWGVVATDQSLPPFSIIVVMQKPTMHREKYDIYIL